MAYTDIDKPSDYFNTVLWTGNSSSDSANQTITGVGFQPDFFWTKVRSHADAHQLRNVIQGNTTRLASNSNGAENTSSCSAVPNADGFVITGDDGTEFNSNGKTYASWNWKAGTAFSNDASATGVGSIDSTGSVNTDAGFSIISYTGTGSAGTVGHGLGAVPKMIIVKSRNTTSLWGVYHQALGNTHGIFLNATNASTSLSAYWNNTSPTSSTFSLGSDADVNASSDPLIAYCFADVKGYSKFGSYTGNGNADGTFVYTGFKPAFVLFKRTSSTSNWSLFDNKRDAFNITDSYIQADTNSAEQEYSDIYVDFLSNGIKQRGTNISLNSSGDSFVYMAFAENPFVTSTGVPTTAR